MKTPKLFDRLHARLGDFWWYSLMLFCACRAAGLLAKASGCIEKEREGLAHFLQERWKGNFPIGWGDTLREAEYTQWVYKHVLGL